MPRFWRNDVIHFERFEHRRILEAVGPCRRMSILQPALKKSSLELGDSKGWTFVLHTTFWSTPSNTPSTLQDVSLKTTWYIWVRQDIWAETLVCSAQGVHNQEWKFFGLECYIQSDSSCFPNRLKCWGSNWFFMVFHFPSMWDALPGSLPLLLNYFMCVPNPLDFAPFWFLSTCLSVRC